MTEYNQDLCNQRHAELNNKHKEIVGFLTDLKAMNEATHRKLFIDNGTESIQSRINRMDNWIKGVCLAVAVLGIPVLLMVIQYVFCK